MKQILKFSATWSTPCKMLKETIDEYTDIPVPVKDLDIEQDFEMARTWNVRSVPTLVLVENGSELRRVVGTLTLPQLRKFVNG